MKECCDYSLVWKNFFKEETTSLSTFSHFHNTSVNKNIN